MHIIIFRYINKYNFFIFAEKIDIFTNKSNFVEKIYIGFNYL